MAPLLLFLGASMSRPALEARQEVTIVSRNVETLDGLQAYLRGAGITARSTRALDDCVKLAPATTLAFVLFPDDFPWENVVATLAELAAQRPDALSVLVTAQPNRFEEVAVPERALVVPRPVWGWKILDALRAHHAGRHSPKKERARAR